MLHHTGAWLGLVPGKFAGLMGWTDRPIRNALRFQYGPDPRGPLVYTRTSTLHGDERTLVRGCPPPAAGIVLLLVAFWIVFHSVFFFGDKRFMISVTPLVAAPLAWMLARTASGARQAALGTLRRESAPPPDREKD